ncbi:MAG: hypothetical protein ABSA52_24575 [Candidatus Binatia bacterium]|jgi:beta-phosphoglucomutase-like phosphatase (HAD superfamily)
MPRRFLLWDHDGVLVDTERWYFEANRTVLRRLQIDLSEPQYLEFMAAGRSRWGLARERQLPETRIQVLRAARDALYQEFLQTKPIEIEGVADLIRKLNRSHAISAEPCYEHIGGCHGRAEVRS